jgi:hypothetical protein
MGQYTTPCAADSEHRQELGRLGKLRPPKTPRPAANLLPGRPCGLLPAMGHINSGTIWNKVRGHVDLGAHWAKSRVLVLSIPRAETAGYFTRRSIAAPARRRGQVGDPHVVVGGEADQVTALVLQQRAVILLGAAA